MSVEGKFVKQALEEQDPYRAFYVLYENSVEHHLQSDSPWEALNHGQRLFLNIYWLTAEVNNGGFTQYVWNSSGDNVMSLVEQLNEIDMNRLADAVSLYLHSVFPAGIAPRDIEARREAMQSYFGTTPFNFDNDPAHLAELKVMKDPDVVTDIFYEVELDIVRKAVSWAGRNAQYFDNPR